MGKKKVRAVSSPRKRSWLGPEIKTGIVFVVIVFVVLAFLAFNLPEEQKLIRFDKLSKQWQLLPSTKFDLSDDSLRISRDDRGIMLFIPNISLNAESYDICVLEMNSPTAFDQGRLFFLSPYNQKYDMNISLDFDTGRANHFNKIFINLKKHPAWQGFISGFLLMPASDAGVVRLRSIKFIKSNTWTKLRAFWADLCHYFDPRLGTCFGMASPQFFNKSFNQVFVPFLWGFLLVVVLVLFAQRTFDLNVKFSNALIIAFFIVYAVLWGTLDVRNNVHYLKAIQRDINLYWGKDLKAKRGIVSGDRKFVEFMDFCDKEIPMKGKIINCVEKDLPGTAYNYLSSTQVYFILRPRQAASRSYYIFYNISLEKARANNERKNLRVYKIYDDRAFILTD